MSDSCVLEREMDTLPPLLPLTQPQQRDERRGDERVREPHIMRVNEVDVMSWRNLAGYEGVMRRGRG